MDKSKMTADELLALKLKGDSSITDQDIGSATKKFFTDRGVNCEITSEAHKPEEDE